MYNKTALYYSCNCHQYFKYYTELHLSGVILTLLVLLRWYSIVSVRVESLTVILQSL